MKNYKKLLQKVLSYFCTDIKIKQSQPSMLFFLLEDKCNFNCRYCSSPSRGDLKELSLDEKLGLIDSSKVWGIKTIVLSGHGEPLLNKHFNQIYDYITSQKFNTVVITNGSRLTKKLAKKFEKNNTVILFKLESLKPEIHNKLCMPFRKINWQRIIKNGKTHQIPASLAMLLTEFRNKEKFIQIESVITKINYGDIIALGGFCKDLGLKFNPKELRIAGNAKKYFNQIFIEKEKLDKLYLSLEKLYGQDFINNLKYDRCLQRDNVVVNKYGQVIVCQSINHSLGNIRTVALPKIYESALKSKKDFPCNIVYYKKLLK